jgi:hypothetical protein
MIEKEKWIQDLESKSGIILPLHIKKTVKLDTFSTKGSNTVQMLFYNSSNVNVHGQIKPISKILKT